MKYDVPNGRIQLWRVGCNSTRKSLSPLRMGIRSASKYAPMGSLRSIRTENSLQGVKWIGVVRSQPNQQAIPISTCMDLAPSAKRPQTETTPYPMEQILRANCLILTATLPSQRAIRPWHVNLLIYLTSSNLTPRPSRRFWRARSIRARKRGSCSNRYAIIWATAKATNSVLVTRNTKDFDPNQVSPLFFDPPVILLELRRIEDVSHQDSGSANNVATPSLHCRD